MYISQKMDEVVNLLKGINRSSASINNIMNSKGSEPKEPKDLQKESKTRYDSIESLEFYFEVELL